MATKLAMTASTQSLLWNYFPTTLQCPSYPASDTVALAETIPFAHFHRIHLRVTYTISFQQIREAMHVLRNRFKCETSGLNFII